MVIHRIHKWGGSFGVVIPVTFLTHLNLTTRDYVEIKLTDHTIEIRPLRKYPKPKKKNSGR